MLEVFELLKNKGHCEYCGEEVTQIEHALQAAYNAYVYAQENRLPKLGKVVLVTACLFHDIGHLVTTNPGPLGEIDHAKIGEEYLKKLGFPYPIPRLVGAHVDAKRYLVRDPGYYEKLSEASRETLVLQGGKMWDDEAKEFEKDDLFNYLLLVRRIDEESKKKNLVYTRIDIEKNFESYPDLRSWKEYLLSNNPINNKTQSEHCLII